MVRHSDELVSVACRLSVRFQHVVFPLDLRTLTSVLQSLGYQPAAQFPPVSPAIVATVGAAGPVAARATTVVDISSERQFIGVQDPSPETAMGAFSELMGALAKGERGLPALQPWFAELQAQFDLRSSPGTAKRIGRAMADLPFGPAWSKILGRPVADFHIRVSPRGVSLDSPDFFDVVLEPNPSSGESAFRVIVIYRSRNPREVLEFARTLDPTIRKLVAAL